MVGGSWHKHTNAVGVPWGPQNCAEIFRSAETGTCVIKTNCNGIDISMFEFVFDCETSQDIQRHTFGRGGFDDVDDFDTNVKCVKCIPPGSTDSSPEQMT